MDIHNSETPEIPTRLAVSDIWRVLKQRRRFIVLFVLVATVFVAAYSFIMPVTYSAVGSLLPPDGEKAGGLSAFLQSATGGIGLGDFGKGGKSGKLVDMLKSRSVAELAIEKSGIDSFSYFRTMTRQQHLDAVRDALWFDMNTNGLVLGGCNIKTGYFASAEEKEQARHLCADVLNAAFGALDSINQEKSVSRARQTRRYIERYLAVNKKKLDSTQAVLEEFSKKNKILSLEGQMTAIVENAVAIGTEIAKAEVKLAEAQAELYAGSPIVVQLERQLRELRGQYDRIQQGGLTEGDAFSIPLVKVPEIARQYMNLVRDVKILEQINAYLESQRAQEAIQEQRDVPVVEVLDAAVAPEKKSSPQRAFMVVTALVLTSILASVWVFLGEVRRNRSYRKVELV